MPDDPKLTSALTEAIAAARAAWPTVTLDDATFRAHLAAHLPADATPESIAAMHVGDLYLACAAAHHDARALRAFETRFLAEVGAFVSHIDRSAAFADEAKQQLREKLLVRGGEGLPKIAEYSGRGPLGGWLRVAAVRTALNMKRGNDGKEAEPPKIELVGLGADPELDYLKTRYGKELSSALQTTLAALSSDERTVLRMHYVDRLNIEEIGLAFKVHRATVARWIAASREKILEETQRLLREKLAMGQGEVESMIGLVRSQLDVSIHRLLL